MAEQQTEKQIEERCEYIDSETAVECQERLGGVLKYYRRAA